MLRIFKSKKKPSQEIADQASMPDASKLHDARVTTTKQSLFKRLKNSLARTRTTLGDGIAHLFLGKKVIDEQLLEEIETQLLLADVGIKTTQAIMSDLSTQVSRKQLKDGQALFALLKQELKQILQNVEGQALVVSAEKKPYVILMVGVNGSGKTTTIGKLAKRLQESGKKVILAAGDTFRAAAIEQLQSWGERNDIPVISQHQGADSASVIYDALCAAQARDVDVVIADTAGRLHTKRNLMDELGKIKRVLKKFDVHAPHEVMLVLDATIGQNALTQAIEFNKVVDVTSITLTKLDGTAKGGIIFAIAKQIALPIRFIGVGEGIDDLRSFHADEFVNALFENDESI